MALCRHNWLFRLVLGLLGNSDKTRTVRLSRRAHELGRNQPLAPVCVTKENHNRIFAGMNEYFFVVALAYDFRTAWWCLDRFERIPLLTHLRTATLRADEYEELRDHCSRVTDLTLILRQDAESVCFSEAASSALQKLTLWTNASLSPTLTISGCESLHNLRHVCVRATHQGDGASLVPKLEACGLLTRSLETLELHAVTRQETDILWRGARPCPVKDLKLTENPADGRCVRCPSFWGLERVQHLTLNHDGPVIDARGLSVCTELVSVAIHCARNVSLRNSCATLEVMRLDLSDLAETEGLDDRYTKLHTLTSLNTLDPRFPFQFPLHTLPQLRVLHVTLAKEWAPGVLSFHSPTLAQLTLVQQHAARTFLFPIGDCPRLESLDLVGVELVPAATESEEKATLTVCFPALTDLQVRNMRVLPDSNTLAGPLTWPMCPVLRSLRFGLSAAHQPLLAGDLATPFPQLRDLDVGETLGVVINALPPTLTRVKVTERTKLLLFDNHCRAIVFPNVTTLWCEANTEFHLHNLLLHFPNVIHMGLRPFGGTALALLKLLAARHHPTLASLVWRLDHTPIPRESIHSRKKCQRAVKAVLLLFPFQVNLEHVRSEGNVLDCQQCVLDCLQCRWLCACV